MKKGKITDYFVKNILHLELKPTITEENYTSLSADTEKSRQNITFYWNIYYELDKNSAKNYLHAIILSHKAETPQNYIINYTKSLIDAMELANEKSGHSSCDLDLSNLSDTINKALETEVRSKIGYYAHFRIVSILETTRQFYQTSHSAYSI